MKYILLILALCMYEEEGLPPAAQAAVDRSEVEIVKIKKSLLEVLKREQDSAARKGDLEGAIAIKAIVERLKVEVDPKKDPKWALVGKWLLSWGPTITLKPDGTFADTRGITGKWNTETDGGFTIIWDDSHSVEKCTKPVGGISVQLGRNVQLTKLPDDKK
jgi:hypothetical protein